MIIYSNYDFMLNIFIINLLYIQYLRACIISHKYLKNDIDFYSLCYHIYGPI